MPPEPELGATKVPPGYLLTIVQARYGADDVWVDVTAKAQSLVKGSQLIVKPEQLVEGDPVPGRQVFHDLVRRLPALAAPADFGRRWPSSRIALSAFLVKERRADSARVPSSHDRPHGLADLRIREARDRSRRATSSL